MTITITTEMQRSPIARSIPGAYYDREVKGWAIDPDTLTPRAATVLLTLFPEIAVSNPEVCEIRDKLVQFVRPFDNATPHNQPLVATELRRTMEAEGKQPYEFQELDTGYLRDVMKQHGAAYLGWERGLGKTIGGLGIIEDLGAKRVLIVAPNTAKRIVWLPDCEKFYGKTFDHIEVLPNTKAKRERYLGWLKNWFDKDESTILIVNYEQLRILGTTRQQWLKYGDWDLVIADEAHRIKNPKAKMTRAIKKIPTRYKLALSGTVIANHPEELFSPLQWMFPDRYSSQWRDWNDRYLDYVDGGFSRICVGVRIDKLDELRQELGVFMTYRRKEDELDLPPITEQTLEVELSPSQRRVYDDLAATCVAELDSGDYIAAANGLPMLTKLRQVATGLDLFDDTGLVSDSSKLDVATELITDNDDEAFVVFSWYRAGARAMEQRLDSLGIENYCVDGSVRQEDRAEYVEDFMAGLRRVFIGTISTMGESINLFRANNAIFLDQSWNPSDNLQARDRIYRIGQDKPVTVTKIVAANTVDATRVVPSVNNKEAVRRLILGG